MRVAIVARPDPGDSFPAIALCLRFLATLPTGTPWLDIARPAGRCSRNYSQDWVRLGVD